MPSIKLESNDNQTFVVDLDAAKCSMLINNMLKDLNMEDGGDEEEIVPVPMVRGEILKLCIDWAEVHKNDDKGAGVTDNAGWDDEFIKGVDKQTLFEIIRAANYLDIKGLLDLATKGVTGMMKGKTPTEIRSLFDMPK